MSDTFDLRADLAEIPLEEDNAYFTMNFKLLQEVRDLRKRHAAADPEEIDIAELEAKLEVKEAELKAASYTVEMMSVPRGRREGIFEEALEKFPAKPSFIPNFVDQRVEFLRQNFVRIEIVAAGIKRIINPQGAVQEENILETVQYLHDDAPDVIFDVLERKSNELNAKGDEQSDLHKSADF